MKIKEYKYNLYDLHEAIINNNIYKFIMCVESGINVNEYGLQFGQPILVSCIDRYRTKFAMLLIDSADKLKLAVNQRTLGGNTVLSWSLYKANLEFTLYLLNNAKRIGLNVNNVSNDVNATPLDIMYHDLPAGWREHDIEQVREKLVELGAKRKKELKK